MKEQNLNIGDTLLCKLNNKVLIKGKSYVICDIIEVSIILNDYIYYISTGSYELLSFWQEFLLYEYFYTKKEERKIKLERLNIL